MNIVTDRGGDKRERAHILVAMITPEVRKYTMSEKIGAETAKMIAAIPYPIERRERVGRTPGDRIGQHRGGAPSPRCGG